MTYTLKQFAKMFGATEHAIRYYTDIGLLPCRRDGRNRRVFDDKSANWMQGIACLKRCGASIEDIKEYCNLCRIPESRENLQARYQIILKQREQTYRRIEEAKAAAAYMDEKARHYEQILDGEIPDDTNPGQWTESTKLPMH